MRKVNSREQRRELFRAPALMSGAFYLQLYCRLQPCSQAGCSALPVPVRSSLPEVQEKERAVRAFAAGPGTQAYPGGDPYNEYQWGFLNDGLFRLTSKNSGAGAAFQNLTSRTGGPAYGPELDSRELPLPKRGWGYQHNSLPRAACGAVEGKTETVVAVIDTGIQTDHEELSGGIWTNADETPGDRTNNDKQLWDDVNGWNFYAGNNQSSIQAGRITTELTRPEPLLRLKTGKGSPASAILPM